MCKLGGELGSEAKVGQLDDTVAIEEHIGTLNVSMDAICLVYVDYCRHYTVQTVRNVRFFERCEVLEFVQRATSRRKK